MPQQIHNNSESLVKPDAEDSYPALRPQELSDFIGQRQLVENLSVYLDAARLRAEPLDHTLFSGPPGLGKTSLAYILAYSQKSRLIQLAAPNVRRPGDLAKVLTTLEEQDVLFIDEIHRLPAPVEELLYSAMEDRRLDLTLAEGLAAQAIQISLPAFTLVGATTRPGALTAPLRDRFGIKMRLEFYAVEELEGILQRAANRWNIVIESEACQMVAERSRRTPRVALRLLRRIWDFALVELGTVENQRVQINQDIVQTSFERMGLDSLGLTHLDIALLKAMAQDYGGGPVGLKTLAVQLGEDTITLEDFYEPYLVQLGFLKRTPRGRVLTQGAYSHLGESSVETPGLFDK